MGAAWGLLIGVGVGIASGMVGIGGGGLMIPAFVFLYGMTQRKAQGTSIAVMLLPVGVLAFWKYWQAGQVDLKLAALTAVGFALGGWVGGAWAQHLIELALRRGFALLLMAIAIRMLLK